MKASGGISRVNSLAAYGAVITLLASIAFSVVPFATPALADPPRPPAVRDDGSRQLELQRRQAIADDQKRQAELERSARAAQASSVWREVQRQTQRLNDESLAAAARAARRLDRSAAKPVPPPSGLAISLQTCNDATPQEALAPAGIASLVGKAWITTTRGFAEAFVRGVTVQLSVAGVAIPNAERFFTGPTQIDHPVLGRVWITRWQYPLAVTTPAPIAINVRWTLDRRLAQLGIFNEDGTPLRYPADFTAALSCTVVPAVAVSGRITGAGVGLTDGRVSAWDVTAGQIRSGAAADATGQFALLLAPGSYQFYFDSAAGPWLPEWWDDHLFFNDATIITLAFGVAAPRLTPDLERGLFVSGRVTDALTHGAIAGVGVSVQRADIQCCEAFFAMTDADGRYRMVVRANVTVKVGFHAQGTAVPYLDQWWNGKASFGEADAIALGTADRANIDAALERGVFVRGHVTDAETGLPLVGASVSASVVGVACCENFFAPTNAQGEYAMAVRTNVSLVVGFFPPLSGLAYVPSYWNGRRSFSDADPLAVGTLEVSGINGALDRGVFLRGRVTDAGTGAGVLGATVYAAAATCCEAFFAQTGLDGTYVAAVRKNVTLRVEFIGPYGGPYLSQWYHAKAGFDSADLVPVTTVDIAGIDAALERGVVLRGRVTDAGTGSAIADTNVTVTRADVACCDSSYVSTDALGEYAVTVRKQTTVTVGFIASSASAVPYLPQWYHGKPTSQTADLVTVGSSDVLGIDAALERGVYLRGRVTDADTLATVSGVGVSGIVVGAPCCANLFAPTDFGGEYRMAVPKNVGLKIYFNPPFGSQIPYIGQWYSAKATFDTADVVSVATTDVSAIDAALARGALVRGRVTDAQTGGGIADVGVNAQPIDTPCCESYFASTQGDGTYVMTVKRGISVKLFFSPSFNDPIAHLGEYWNDRRSFEDADVLPIGSVDITAIDAALERGVWLSGRVTDAQNHLPLPQVSVNASNTDPCCENYFGFTDSTGGYQMAVRANISARVSFYPPFGSDFLQEYYNDKASFGSADLVTVGTTAVTGIDAALELGVRLSGRVTDAVGSGIANAFVNIETETCCEFVAGTATALDGTYSLALRPGRYKVAFYPPFGSDFLSEYYDNKTYSGVATVVVVGAAPVSGIDATLEPGVPLSGRVTDAASGLAVAGVGVSLSSADPENPFGGYAATDADGMYSIIARAGRYKIFFYPPSTSDLFFEYYDNVADFSNATVVVVGSAPVTGIDAELGSAQDLTAPATVDARVAQTAGGSDFMEPGDAFTLTFSHRMDMRTDRDTIQIEDPDGTTVTLRCGAAPNDVACDWDATATTVTITVDVTLDIPGPGTVGSGTTPGLQIPFNITALSGFADTRGFPAYVLGSPDSLVDHE